MHIVERLLSFLGFKSGGGYVRPSNELTMPLVKQITSKVDNSFRILEDKLSLGVELGSSNEKLDAFHKYIKDNIDTSREAILIQVINEIDNFINSLPDESDNTVRTNSPATSGSDSE